MIEVNQVRATSIIGPTNIPRGDLCCNPYIGCAHGCKYCYASFMNRFAGHDIPWGSYVDVKNWPDMSSAFLRKLKNKTIIFGSVTDCYQPVEEEFCKTRAVLRAIQKVECSPCIITKSDLVLRDLELIKSFPTATVAFSINTLDESFRRDMDKAVSIERRLKAMHAFYQQGVRTVCFISPIFPELTNVNEIFQTVRNQCDAVWLENLNLRFGFRGAIFDYIDEKYPQYSSIYNQIFAGYLEDKSYDYWEEYEKALPGYAAKEGCPYYVNEDPPGKATPGYPAIVNYLFHKRLVSDKRKKVKPLPSKES